MIYEITTELYGRFLIIAGDLMHAHRQRGRLLPSGMGYQMVRIHDNDWSIRADGSIIAPKYGGIAKKFAPVIYKETTAGYYVAIPTNADEYYSDLSGLYPKTKRSYSHYLWERCKINNSPAEITWLIFYLRTLFPWLEYPDITMADSLQQEIIHGRKWA